MSEKKNLLTYKGLKELEDELQELKVVKRKEVAEKIYERHTLLTNFLISLGVDEDTASEDACRLEHVISDKSFAAIKRYALEKGEN